MNIKITDNLIPIAYADDHVVVRKGIALLLNNLGGISVEIEADNGRDLITQLEAAPILPSICMLDINMPELDGFDTIVAIKKKWPEMKVLILTFHTSELYIIRMIRSGANGYLVKDCHPLEIKNALYAIVNTGIYHSNILTNQFTSSVLHDLIKIPTLTDRETIVLRYSCTDMTYTEIAEQMKTTKRSVEGYRDSLFRKLQVNSRVSLALFAVRFGLISLDIATQSFFPLPNV